MSTTTATGLSPKNLAEDSKAGVASGERAEDIGIVIGPTVVKLDWHSSIPLPASPARGSLLKSLRDDVELRSKAGPGLAEKIQQLEDVLRRAAAAGAARE
jgi:hypothetical protein